MPHCKMYNPMVELNPDLGMLHDFGFHFRYLRKRADRKPGVITRQ